jgi:uncharacterized membrane protein YecN with MAPEG domain
MALDARQRGVLRGMLSALALAIAVGIAAVLAPPAALIPLDGPADRLIAALRWDVLVVACLILSIGALARHRFFTPADIDGSGLTNATDRARLLQAILQNTLEQTVIALSAHLVWAAAMPVAWHALVPAAAILFVFGRICFVVGYGGGAPARAFGFALTFYPTVLMALVAGLTLAGRALEFTG